MNRVQMILIDVMGLPLNVGSYPKGMFQIKHYMSDSEIDASFWTTVFGGNFTDKQFPEEPLEEPSPLYINGKRFIYFPTLNDLMSADHGAYFDIQEQLSVIKFPEYDFFMRYNIFLTSAKGLVSEATMSLLGLPVEARYMGTHFDTTLLEGTVSDSRTIDSILAQRMTFYDFSFSLANYGQYDNIIDEYIGSPVTYLIADYDEETPITIADFKPVAFGNISEINYSGFDRVQFRIADVRDLSRIKINPNKFSLEDSSRINKDLIGKNKPIYLNPGENIDFKIKDILCPTLQYYESDLDPNKYITRFVSDPIFGVNDVIGIKVNYTATFPDDGGDVERTFFELCSSTQYPVDCKFFTYNRLAGTIILDMQKIYGAIKDPDGTTYKFEDCFALPVIYELKINNNPNVPPGNAVDMAIMLMMQFSLFDYNELYFDTTRIDSYRRTAPLTTQLYIDESGMSLSEAVEKIISSANIRIQPVKNIITMSDLSKRSASYYIKEDEIDTRSIKIYHDTAFFMNTIKLNYRHNPDSDSFMKTLFRSEHIMRYPQFLGYTKDYEKDIYLWDSVEAEAIAKARYDLYSSIPQIVDLRMTVPIQFNLFDYVLFTLKRPYSNDTIMPLSYYEVIGISKTAKTVKLLYSHPYGGNPLGEFTGKPYGPQDVYLESPYGLLIEGVA